MSKLASFFGQKKKPFTAVSNIISAKESSDDKSVASDKIGNESKWILSSAITESNDIEPEIVRVPMITQPGTNFTISLIETDPNKPVRERRLWKHGQSLVNDTQLVGHNAAKMSITEKSRPKWGPRMVPNIDTDPEPDKAAYIINESKDGKKKKNQTVLPAQQINRPRITLAAKSLILEAKLDNKTEQEPEVDQAIQENIPESEGSKDEADISDIYTEQTPVSLISYNFNLTDYLDFAIIQDSVTKKKELSWMEFHKNKDKRIEK